MKTPLPTPAYTHDRRWPFARDSAPTLLAATLLFGTAVLLWFQFPHWLSGLFLVLTAMIWLLVIYFFRDPNREITAEAGVVVGPGDGEVVVIRREHESRYLDADVIRISMFLSVTDVHVQRVPLGGKVTVVDHQPGQFLQAFKPEASEVNEFVAMVVASEYGRVLLKQIAGILARRCVNHAQPGDQLQTGQRFGLIKFSSRLDLYLPPDAQLLVQVGDKITGGITPIARL